MQALRPGRSVRGPMGLALSRLPTARGLAYERSASLSGLAVAWLKRIAYRYGLEQSAPLSLDGPGRPEAR